MRRALALVFVIAACGGTSRPAATSSTTRATASTPTVAPTIAATSTSVAVTSTTAPATSTTTVRPAAPAQRIWRGNTGRAVVAFTFDAGSDAGATASILDLLAANRIQASFGITGDWARANPALLRRIVAAGHHLINHTDSHRSFTGRSTGTAPLSSAQREAQVTGAERAVQTLAGVSMRPYFRPPYGDIDAATDVDVARVGYRYDVLWTVDSLGWKGTPAETVAQRCLDGAGNGVIYLFHVGAQSTDIAALPAIITGLRARGFSIGSVDAVL